MPELPDVEVYRRYFNATALHQIIERVRVKAPSLLLETSPQGLGRALKHKSFQLTRRYGKYLFAALDSPKWLVLHFGMSGDLKYFEDERDAPDYTQLLITFDNGFHLAYIAPRKLGRIALIDAPETLITRRKLGADALDVSEKQFCELASARRGSVKSWLMDQESIAGIGNIYSDEILFQAGIHPGRSVNDLDKKALKELYKTMRFVLKAAIGARADPDRMPPTFLLPHREKRGRCPRCDAPLTSISAAGRSAWYCPRCQTTDSAIPRPL